MLRFDVADAATGRVNDVEAVFTWLDGRKERVIVHRVGIDRAYVSWPDSRREVAGRECERPNGWVPRVRLTMPHIWTVMSPNGVDHLMVNRRCATCGLGHDWLIMFGDAA